MLAIPRCFERQCEHYLGVVQSDGTESTETNSCNAFPDGIPRKIAYGSNRHLEPLPNQENDVVFKKIKKERV